MPHFSEQTKNFLAIIIGAVIIGGFVYFGLQNNSKQSKILVASPAPVVSYSTQISSPIIKPDTTTSAATSATTCGAANNTIVTKVIDGDTVVVEGGYHIRLLGMDADEAGYPCYAPAKTRLEDLVLAKQVKLEKDISDLDQYGRCLRYIFVGNTNVDVQLVQEGLAVARFYAPDVKYKSEIVVAEQYAQQNKVGCKWSGSSQTIK